MAAVLAVTATVVCAVRVLRPEHLTPIANRIANSSMNADVRLGRVELAFRPSFPILEVNIDSAVVISRAFAGAPGHSELPPFADSLVTIDRLRIAMDLARLVSPGEIHLSDIEIVRPGLNIVLDSTGKGNFDIFPASTDTASSSGMPAISIGRFSMEEPRLIRYYDAIDSSAITLSLARMALDGLHAPLYSVSVRGKVNCPAVCELVDLDDIDMAIDGNMRWSPAEPELITAESIRLRCEFLSALLNCRVRLGQTLNVESASLAVDPIRIDSVLALIPQAVAREYRIDKSRVYTDMAVGLEAALTAPFIPAADTVPCGSARITIPLSTFNYKRIRLHDIYLDLTAELNGRSYDNARLILNRFTAAGPATSVSAEGVFSNLLSDPTFDCNVQGDMALAMLPDMLRNELDGAIDGNLRLNLSAIGRRSMLEMGKFHNLDVNGEADGYNLYYMKADTSKFASISHVSMRFGSQYAARRSYAQANTLGALIKVDSLEALVSGVEMRMGDMSIGLGMENGGRPADSLEVVPMGGGIRIARFSAIAAADSMGVRMRGLRGHLMLRQHQGDRLIPEISLDAGMDRLVAGGAPGRAMIRNSHLKALAYLRPDRIRQRRETAAIADSLVRIYPQLPPDSIFAYAEQIRRSRHGRGIRRVGMAVVDSAEYLDFNMSGTVKRILNDWYIGGEFSAARARLNTPYFPIRNSLEHINLAFNTDSIVIDSLRYRGGRSDMAVNGVISNIRPALLGRRKRPVKLDFEIFSDTLEINELAAGAFSGAAHAELVRRGGASASALTDNDDELERDFEALTNPSDTMAPVLIPVNVDANIALRADNIFYSDLLLHNLTGDVLVYDGAVNLNDLAAYSEAGNIQLSALYSAPRSTDIKFGLGLKLDSFNIRRFLTLMPAIDSLMPLMRDFAGTINADIAATVNIDSTMNMELPSLDAAVRLSGSNLEFINHDTYSKIGKWLLFRDRTDNRIGSMSVQLTVRNNRMQIYPFKFDLDRYTIGVSGYNDMAMNFDYNIAVLKSPLPFKFGVSIKGNPEKYKVRLGRARFNLDTAASDVNLVDDMRINLIEQIRGIFRRGVSRSRFARLDRTALQRDSRGMISSDASVPTIVPDNDANRPDRIEIQSPSSKK